MRMMMMTTTTIMMMMMMMALCRYRWLVGSWGECILQQSKDVCGTGLQNRTVLCVTASGLRNIVFHLEKFNRKLLVTRWLTG